MGVNPLCRRAGVSVESTGLCRLRNLLFFLIALCLSSFSLEIFKTSVGSRSIDLASLALLLELDGEKCDHCLMSIVHFLSVVSFHRLCSSEPFYFLFTKVLYLAICSVFKTKCFFFCVFLIFHTWCNRSCKDVPLYL